MTAIIILCPNFLKNVAHECIKVSLFAGAITASPELLMKGSICLFDVMKTSQAPSNLINLTRMFVHNNQTCELSSGCTACHFCSFSLH